MSALTGDELSQRTARLRPTDEELAEWLYDAEFDSERWIDNGCVGDMPRDTFPKYYADDYEPTLAALFREIIESRARLRAGRGGGDGGR